MTDSVYIGKSDNLKGIRCVKASRNFKSGELVESCPIIMLPESQTKYIEKTELTNYEYIWNSKFDCIVLGFGSIYNHSFTPNAKYVRNYRKKTMDYYAIKDIRENEEILVNYNGSPENTTPIEPEYLDFKR